MEQDLLELNQISCGYGKKIIIKDITLTMKRGEIVCLLGPNGVGKTTLFKTILGFIQLKNGKILIEGEDISGWNRKKMAKAIAYVPQAHHSSVSFTVLDIVLMGRTASLGFLKSPGKTDILIAEQILENMGIGNLRDISYSRISGGQQQMTLIARALAQEAKILVMDEPTSSLDYGNQIKILEQINSLAKRGLGVIMTSHYPNHAFLCATKAALLQRNHCFVTGRVDDIVFEESLKETYGIDVRIASVSDAFGRNVKGCIPVLSKG